MKNNNNKERIFEEEESMVEASILEIHATIVAERNDRWHVVVVGVHVRIGV